MGKIYIAYPVALPLRGIFYQRVCRATSWHSLRAPSVDRTNGSFYALQNLKYSAWFEATTPDFIFSTKAIATSRTFGACAISTYRWPMCSPPACSICGKKLGPFLWQFPPSFRYDADGSNIFSACCRTTLNKRWNWRVIAIRDGGSAACGHR